MAGITGFDVDNQRIAKAQVLALNQLTEVLSHLIDAVDNLSKVIRNKS